MDGSFFWYLYHQIISPLHFFTFSKFWEISPSLTGPPCQTKFSGEIFLAAYGCSCPIVGFSLPCRIRYFITFWEVDILLASDVSFISPSISIIDSSTSCDVWIPPWELPGQTWVSLSQWGCPASLASRFQTARPSRRSGARASDRVERLLDPLFASPGKRGVILLWWTLEPQL